MMEKVCKFIEKYHMIVNGDKVIAGISGGADSVCLLFVLLELRKSLDIDIVAVHVNHGIRGDSARADEEFTVKLCRGHGIKCVVYHENVESIAKKRKQSVEEAGRNVRREAFEKTFREEQGTKIAMAHHQNDNAETLLMNLARGAGLKGLGGIRPVNGNVIRPLLCLTRGEIENYLEKNGYGWCQDETNDEDDYTRNRLRHLVIPVLEQQVNAGAVQHMNEAMEQIRMAWEYMEEQTTRVWNRCVAEMPDKAIQIRKEGYAGQPEAIQKILVRKCLIKAAGAEKNLSIVHVEAVMDLMEKQSGRSRNLPYSVKAVRNYDGVMLKKVAEKAGQQEEKEADSGQYILKVPGITEIKELNLTICSRILEKSKDFSVNQIPQKSYTKWFDYDIIKGNLTVRTRRPGDFLVIDSAGNRQKLKSYFINEKIPADKRDICPLVTDEEQILWVLGYRISSACMVSDKTNRVLEIKVTEEKRDVRED